MIYICDERSTSSHASSSRRLRRQARRRRHHPHRHRRAHLLPRRLLLRRTGRSIRCTSSSGRLTLSGTTSRRLGRTNVVRQPVSIPRPQACLFAMHPCPCVPSVAAANPARYIYVAGSTPTSADFGDKAWSSVCVSAVKSLAQAASQAQSNTHLTHETVDVRRRRARATGRRTGRARAPRALAMPTTSSCAPGGPACTCAPSASSPSPVCPPRIRR